MKLTQNLMKRKISGKVLCIFTNFRPKLTEHQIRRATFENKAPVDTCYIK